MMIPLEIITILCDNILKVKFYNADDFEINEIDEDMYTESNFEEISNKNSRKMIKRKKRTPSLRKEQIESDLVSS